MQRRELVARAAAVLGGVTLAGCADDGESPPASNDWDGPVSPAPPGQRPTAGAVDGGGTAAPSDEPDPASTESVPVSDDRFDAVVDAVDDLGMDPDGNEPIDDALEATFDRNVLIEVPPGEYRFTRSHRVEDLRNWGLRGTGDHRGDVRFVVAEGTGALFLNVRSGRNVLVEGVTFDMRPTRPEWINNVFETEDGTVLRDVEYAGFHPSEGLAVDAAAFSGGLLRVRVTEPSGIALVDGLVRRGPTELGPYPRGHSGISYGGGSEHEGVLRIQDSWLENMSQHGTYCSRASGTVEILRTTFKNCNGSSIRIGGEDSFARRCRVVYDDTEILDGNVGTLQTATGVIFDGGGDDNWFGHGGAVVEDSVFEFRSLPPSVASGVVWVDGSHGTATLRNSYVANDTAAFTVRAGATGTAEGSRYQVSGRTPSRPWGVIVEGVEIVGGAGEGLGAVSLHGRPESTIRDTTITLSSDVAGVLLDGSHDCQLVGLSVDTARGAGFHIRESVGTLLDGGTVRSGGVPILLNFDRGTDGSLLRVENAPEMTWTEESTSGVGSVPIGSTLRELGFDGTVDVSMLDGDTSAGVVGLGRDRLQIL